MNYDSWKLDSPDETISEDYESDRYVALKNMYDQADQKAKELTEWWDRVKHIKGQGFKEEYEHDLDILHRAMSRIMSAMELDEANY